MWKTFVVIAALLLLAQSANCQEEAPILLAVHGPLPKTQLIAPGQPSNREVAIRAIKETGDIAGAINNIVQLWWLIKNWNLK